MPYPVPDEPEVGDVRNPGSAEVLVEVELNPGLTSRGINRFDSMGVSLRATEVRFKVSVLSGATLQRVKLHKARIWLSNIYEYTLGTLSVQLSGSGHGVSEPVFVIFPVAGLYFADADLSADPPVRVIPKQRLPGKLSVGDGRARDGGPRTWRTPVPVAERFAVEQTRLNTSIRWLTAAMFLMTIALLLLAILDVFH